MKSSHQDNSEQRLEPEPRATQASIPRWLPAAAAVLILFTAILTWKNLRDLDPQVFQPYQSSAELAKAQPPSTEGMYLMEGLTIYTANCAICHQSTGLGDPQKAPSLVGAEWLLAPGPNRLARILLDGFTGPINLNGQIWNLNMPAWKNNLTDQQIASVLSYIRNEWGNHAPEIKAEQITAVRQETKGRATPWTAEELARIAEQ